MRGLNFATSDLLRDIETKHLARKAVAPPSWIEVCGSLVSSLKKHQNILVNFFSSINFPSSQNFIIFLGFFNCHVKLCEGRFFFTIHYSQKL